jgi:hypothetical protein
MRALVLDSEAVSRLSRVRRGQTAPGQVQAFLEAAFAVGAPVRVPAAVLAEQYRGGGHDQRVDAWLARLGEGIKVVATDRSLARTAGNLLAAHRRGTEDHVDVTVVATAYRLGGAVILTGDEGDIKGLAAGLPGITVEVLR